MQNILSDSPDPLENAAADPDVGLMLRVRDDDAVAFEMLIDRHQSKIQRFMQGWVNNVQQSEDLAQDVFLRVYKARKTYLPTAKFTTWLYRIANNIASNYVRDSSHRREYQLSHSAKDPGVVPLAIYGSNRFFRFTLALLNKDLIALTLSPMVSEISW